MDQPAPEILRLEKVLDAYAQYEDKERKKDEARNKNRGRHSMRSVKETGL